MRVELRIDDYAPYYCVVETNNLWLLRPAQFRKLLAGSRWWLDQNRDTLAQLRLGIEEMTPPESLWKFCDEYRVDVDLASKQLKYFSNQKKDLMRVLVAFAEKYNIIL